MNSDYFYIGMTLEVLNEDGGFIFLGKVTDVDPDFVKIVNAKGDSTPPTFHGTVVKVRGFLSGMRPVNAQGKICGSSPDCPAANSRLRLNSLVHGRWNGGAACAERHSSGLKWLTHVPQAPNLLVIHLPGRESDSELTGSESLGNE